MIASHVVSPYSVLLNCRLPDRLCSENIVTRQAIHTTTMTFRRQHWLYSSRMADGGSQGQEAVLHCRAELQVSFIVHTALSHFYFSPKWIQSYHRSIRSHSPESYVFCVQNPSPIMTSTSSFPSLLPFPQAFLSSHAPFRLHLHPPSSLPVSFPPPASVPTRSYRTHRLLATGASGPIDNVKAAKPS